MVKRFVCSMAVVVVAVVVLSFVGVAGAAVPAAGWSIESFAAPSSFSAGDSPGCEAGLPACDAYEVTATNVGGQATDGSQVTLSDTLPAGLTVKQVSFIWRRPSAENTGFVGTDLAPFGLCSTTPLRCTFPGVLENIGVHALMPDDRLEMIVSVTVDDPNAVGGLTNTATVSGGGAAGVLTVESNRVGGSTPLFGAGAFSALLAGVDGAPETQAGAHPYELRSAIGLNSVIRRMPERAGLEGFNALQGFSVHDVRDAVFDLPPGFAGSALSTPTCTLAQMSSLQRCPPDTQVGHIFTEPVALGSVNSPLWNIAPEKGVPAEFGFVNLLRSSHVLYTSVVATPKGYVLRGTTPEIPQAALGHVIISLYGNPAAHNGTGNTPVAQFTNPSDCSGEPLVTSIHVDSWQSPAQFNADGTPDFSDPNWVGNTSESPPVTGCNLLHFDGAITARPDTTVAGEPLGP